jgi:hypothetical protein
MGSWLLQDGGYWEPYRVCFKSAVTGPPPTGTVQFVLVSNQKAQAREFVWFVVYEDGNPACVGSSNDAAMLKCFGWFCRLSK